MIVQNQGPAQVGALASETLLVPVQVIKTVALVATPEVLAADGTYFHSATLVGIKAARTDNVGTVYLGIGTTNDTQLFPIEPGASFSISAPEGYRLDLNDFALDVLNAGDGVGIIYW